MNCDILHPGKHCIALHLIYGKIGYALVMGKLTLTPIGVLLRF